MSNPDGMRPYRTAPTVYSTATASTSLSLQHPPSSQSNNTSTSVKDLIDLAIEDALGGGTANDACHAGTSSPQSIMIHIRVVMSDHTAHHFPVTQM